MAEHSQHSNILSGEPNTLYVGQGVCVKGDISVPGIVVVDGTVEGTVDARAIWVSPSGVIKGTIVATEAEIRGTVSETIEIKQLLIVHATGRVLGDVRYGELQLEKGAVISGTLSCVSDEKETAVESVLGKSERPKVVHRIEPSRPVNGAAVGNGAALHGKLPPADYRVAS
jgi:cytoskeletal protein CcmA (bactofilin family)